MKIKNYKFLILIVLSFFILFSSEVKAADEHTISPSFPIEMCVTDDVNKDTVMNRCTVEGYSKVSVVTPTDGLDVNTRALGVLNDSILVYPHGASSYYDETGTSGALVKNSSATLLRVIVGTAGTASTLNIWDRGADTTCTSGTEKLTLDTTSISNIYLGIAMTNGICVISTTGTPAKITIVYE